MAEYSDAPQGKGKATSTPPDLDKLKKMLDDCRANPDFITSRQQAEINRDYYDSAFSDNSQLTPLQRAILKDRKQPEIVINRVKPAINGILGVVVAGKTDPRALMRNPPEDKPQPQQQPGQAPAPQPDLDAGDVATMSLRYIADVNQFQAVKLDMLENMAIEGTGAVIVETDQDQEVRVTQIRWEEHFFDPRSRWHDYSDARYQGVAKWMYADDVAALYPGKGGNIEDVFSSGDVSGGADQSWLDRPTDAATKPSWSDSKTRRIMVVELYYREGGSWQRCVFHAGGILLEEPSPYKDDKGRTVCPIEAQAAFIDRKNRRYGLVSDMRGPQDEINMRRIKAVHEINTRQVQQKDPNAPPIDVEEARREAAKPDGVLPMGWEIVPRQDVIANSLTLLAEAKSEIERMGPNPAILGRQGADASGRAQQIRQQAGMTELSRFLGRFTDWEQRVYRQMWARARQSWSDPKWIRVTDDIGAPQYVRINEPVAPDPMTGQPPIDPRTGQPVPGKNHIALMDVDIIVDSVPDTATLQQEIFTEFTQLAQAYVGTPMQVPFNILIEMSPLPKKREILKKLEGAQAQAAQAAAPGQQMQAAQQQAETQRTQSEAERAAAQAKNIEVKTVTDAMHGHMDARAAQVMPPGMSEVANLPQNQPQPPGAA